MGVGDDADPHACSIRPAMDLLCETPWEWVELAVEKFDEVLVDHAHCEKKAAASALSLLSAFPSIPGLARAMARLAREESGHLAQVLALVEKRGLSLGRGSGRSLRAGAAGDGAPACAGAPARPLADLG